LADHPLKNTAEVEIVCRRCSYRMMRTAARLRRETGIVCSSCGEPVAPGTDERAKDASGPSEVE
jgi:DNA-directed RNA polymerase subunit RPC12/RpoP